MFGTSNDGTRGKLGGGEPRGGVGGGVQTEQRRLEKYLRHLDRTGQGHAPVYEYILDVNLVNRTNYKLNICEK